MADPAAPPAQPVRSSLPGWPIFLAITVVVVVLLPPGSEASGWQSRFIHSFIGLVLEALPFLLIGGLMAGVIDVLLPDHWLPALGRRFGRAGLPLVALLSPALPLCECGVVGVGRGLVRKGLPLAHTAVYLLAAPILNPIVLVTTWLAFSSHPDAASYVIWRAGGGILVPVAIGFLLWRVDPRTVLLPEFHAAGCAHDHAHGHGHDDCGHGHDDCGHSHHTETRRKPITTLLRICDSARSEFTDMATWFVVGIAIAAGLKTAVGTDAIGDLAANPIWGAPVMMAAAFLLSLCSEVDAFVAAAFPEASIAAVTAFLVFGPMIDIRLLLLYRSVVKGRYIFAFAGLITLVNLLYAWALVGMLA